MEWKRNGEPYRFLLCSKPLDPFWGRFCLTLSTQSRRARPSSVQSRSNATRPKSFAPPPIHPRPSRGPCLISHHLVHLFPSLLDNLSLCSRPTQQLLTEKVASSAQSDKNEERRVTSSSSPTFCAPQHPRQPQR